MQPNRLPAILVIIIFCMLTACGNKREQRFEYIPLSQFILDSNVIAPGSAVKIIGYSGGEESKKDQINFFQFIVVNQANGDTVRVLATLINVPGEAENGTFTSPIMFDGDKGVFDATYEQKDSSQNMMARISAEIADKSPDMEALKKIAADTSNTDPGKEWVIVNKSLPAFDNPKYKTTIGILKFSSVPW